MRYVVFFLGILFFLNVAAQTPPLTWAKRVGGSQYTEVQAMTSDSSGNLYYLGYFSETVDFDPGPNTTTLYCTSLADMFVSKLDSGGNLMWVKPFTCNGYEWTADVCYAPDGSLYVSGYFTQGTMDLDPGAGSFTVTATNSYISFLVKLDLNGNFIWAKCFDPGNLYIADLAVDHAGNIYAGGTCYDPSDFDPGPGTHTLSISNVGDIFVLKLDQTGNFVWARNFQHQSGVNYFVLNSLDVDQVGNVYSTGAFQNTIDFDPGPSTHIVACSSSTNVNGSYLTDLFIHKLDASGNFVWVNTYGNGQRTFGKALKTDLKNNISIVGGFSGTLDIDAGAGTHTLSSAINNNLLLLKLDASGSLIWGRATGGAVFPQQEGKNIEVDNDQSLYVCGVYSGNANLDPGTSNFTISTPSNVTQAFVAKYDSLGHFKWGGAMGGDAFDRSNSVCMGLRGSLYVGSVFTSSLGDADPGTGTYSVSADTSVTSIIIVKLQQLCSGGITIYGNSSPYCEQEPVSLTASGNGLFHWYATPGSTLVTSTGPVFHPGTLSSGVHTFTVDNEVSTCAQAETVVTVTVDACTSVFSAAEQAGLNVFPNPGTGKFIIRTDSHGEGERLEILSVEGKLLFTQGLGSYETFLDLGQLAPGVYLLKISGSNDVTKLVKVASSF